MSAVNRTSATGLRITFVLGVASLLLWQAPAVADDPGWHSSICTADGSIMDYELAEYVGDRINAHGGEVKDVKIILNTCYGGGFLDDFQELFGPGGACAGVPWVFGAAAGPDERAWCYRDSWAESDDPLIGPKNLGSKYTSALAGPESGYHQSTPGSMHDDFSDRVIDDLDFAVLMDEAGPFWVLDPDETENPVVAAGNGGEGITWHTPGEGHQAVFFGGVMDHPAYYNDFENMTDGLTGQWGADGGAIQTVPNGTTQDLLDAIDIACMSLDGNTQLILYFTDHGDRHFNFNEWYYDEFGEHFPDHVTGLLEVSFPLDIEWVDALQWMADDPFEAPAPTLDLTLLAPIEGAEWSISINGLSVPLPPGVYQGDVQLPVLWQSMLPGDNLLRIEATMPPPSTPMMLEELELSSGPIAMRRVLEDVECFTLADCADTDGDNLRDDPCLWYACESGNCLTVPRGMGTADVGGFNGACPADGGCDLNDKYHVQNCFANQDTLGNPGYPCEDDPASPLNVDAVGFNGSCVLDGVCDINDQFAADNCFANQDTQEQQPFPCQCPAPAAGPQRPPAQPVSQRWAGLTLRAPRSAQPGDRFEVDLYLDQAMDVLRGYQLHLGVSGGQAGAFRLVDIFVDTSRRDYAFGGTPEAPWIALNKNRQQMYNALDGAGVATAAGSYLATFTYQVSKNAAGEFVVELLHDQVNPVPVQRTLLFATPGEPIGVASTKPAVIRVGHHERSRSLRTSR